MVNGVFASDLDGFGVTGLDLGLLMLRLTIGGLVVARGVNRIWGRGGIAASARWFHAHGMEPAPFHAWLTGIGEIASGTTLVLGFLNPLAAAGVVGICAVSLVVRRSHEGFFPSSSRSGYDHVLGLCLVGLAMGAIGPGRWSIDYLIGNDLYGLLGLAVTAVIGLGGALVVLVGFWRPAVARA